MRKIFALFVMLYFVAIALPLILATVAFAQQPVVVSPASPLHDLWVIVQPLIVLLVSTVGPALVAWISYRLVGLLKITDENAKMELERRIRDALHASAANALKYAMTRAGLVPAAGVTIPPSILYEAIEYVRTKNPDTVEQSGVDDNDLEQIILSKVPDLIGMAVNAARR